MPPTNVELAAKVEQLAGRVEQLETSGSGDAPATSSSSSASTARLVDFETTDPLLGTPISGVGVVVEEDESGVLVAPLQVQGIRLQPDELKSR